MDPRRDTAASLLSEASTTIHSLLVLFSVANVSIIILTIVQYFETNDSSFGAFASGIMLFCFLSLFFGIFFGLAGIPDIEKLEREASRKREKKIDNSEKREKYDNLQEKAADDGDKANTFMSPTIQITLTEHEAILNKVKTKYEEDTKTANELYKKELKEEAIKKENKYHEERAQHEEQPFIFRAGINNDWQKKTTNNGDKFDTPTIRIPLAKHRALMNEVRTKCEKDIKRATDKCKKEFKEKAKEKKNKYHEEKAKWEYERYSFGYEYGRLEHFENIVLNTPAWYNPFATNPYGLYPYATYPYCAYPYHTYTYCTAYGTSQTGTNQDATNRNATKENGANKTATTKNNAEQSGRNPNGTNVATPNGTTPNGTTPNPYGTLYGPYGTNPNRTYQSGTSWQDVLIAGSKLPNPNACVGQIMQVPNLATTLVNAPVEQQRTILGEHLYPLVDQIEHEHASKVTGMLLEMDETEVLYLIDSPDALKAKVSEAMEVLKKTKTVSTCMVKRYMPTSKFL